MAYDPNAYDEDPYVAWARAQPYGVPMPEYPIEQPLSPPPQQIAPMGAPVAEEVPVGKIQPAPGNELEPLPENPPLVVDAVSAAAPAATPSDVLAHEATITTEPYAPPQPSTGADYVASFASPETRDAYVEYQQAQLAEQPLPSMRETEAQKQAADEQRAIASMTPEQLVQFKSDRDSILMLKQARAERDALEADHRKAQENFAIQEEVAARTAADMKAVIADAQRLANTKVDPDRYRKTRGLGQELGDIFAAFSLGLSGNMDAAMNVVDSKIERDIQAQTADLNNQYQALGLRRGAIAEEYARHQDLHRARESYRLAAYQNLSDRIKTDLQQYDPAGSIAMRKREQLAQLEAAKAAAAQKIEADRQKHNLEVIKTAVDVRKQMLEESKFDFEKQKAAAKAGAVKPIKFEDEPRTLDDLRGMGFKIPADFKLPAGATGISIRQARTIAEGGKATEDWGKAARENSPEELARATGVEQLKDVDGKQLTFIDNKKVAGAYEASDNAVRILDELISLRETQGGSTDLMKSPAWRKAHVKFANLLLNQKTRDELGALTGSDLQLEAKKLGTSDPTEWRDPRPGLLEARRQIVEGMNTMLRTQAPGQNPARWGPPPPQPPAPKTPEDTAFQKALKWDIRYGDGSQAVADELGLQRTSSYADLNQKINAGLAENHGVLPSIRKSIDDLAKVTKDPSATDEARKDANSKLTQLTKEAESSAVREYATSVRFGGGEE